MSAPARVAPTTGFCFECRAVKRISEQHAFGGQDVTRLALACGHLAERTASLEWAALQR